MGWIDEACDGITNEYDNIVKQTKPKINMFDNQLIRCSALGRIMTNDRSGKSMGQTAKTYLEELFLQVKYGIRKDVVSKYISKGLAVEESAIALLSKVHDEFYTKNDEFKSNEFICGTCDIIQDGVIRDIKSAWDATTFPFFEHELPKKDYYYQAHGYMWLWDAKEAFIDYVLIDTPEQLIEDEKRRTAWKMGIIDDVNQDYLNACAEIDRNHRFSQIPDEERVKSFRIERDEKVIDAIKERVLECREYLKSL